MKKEIGLLSKLQNQINIPHDNDVVNGINIISNFNMQQMEQIGEEEV